LSVVNRSCRSECSDRWSEGRKFCLKLSDRRSERITVISFYVTENYYKKKLQGHAALT